MLLPLTFVGAFAGLSLDAIITRLLRGLLLISIFSLGAGLELESEILRQGQQSFRGKCAL